MKVRVMTVSSGSSSRYRFPVQCFAVTAEAEPGAMPRVLEVFAKRGLVPSQWHSTIAGHHGNELQIDIQVADVDSDLARRLADTLRQVVAVRSVLVAEKRRLLTA
jgi:acetolactate synthase regulatory subunit